MKEIFKNHISEIGAQSISRDARKKARQQGEVYSARTEASVDPEAAYSRGKKEALKAVSAFVLTSMLISGLSSESKSDEQSPEVPTMVPVSEQVPHESPLNVEQNVIEMPAATETPVTPAVNK